MWARFRLVLQRIKIHPIATVLITLLIIVATLIILCILGYIFDWGWTGLPSQSVRNGFQLEKTLWDWMQLLFIPTVLAISGFLFTLTVNNNERKAADQRNKVEREIAQDNQHEATLQEYIDKMSELLLHEKLRESKTGDEVRQIARVRTLTTLSRLDKMRKAKVLQFLYESNLILKNDRIVDLEHADFSHTDLSEAYLHNANLSHANLRQAELKGINLNRADLSYADLRGANLSQAHLEGTNLENADLSEVNLSNAHLRDKETNLSNSTLKGANLR